MRNPATHSIVPVLVLWLCLSIGSFAQSLAQSSVGQPDPSLLLGTFRGKLPCADCIGLEMQLTLVKKSEGATDGTYILKETYLGKAGPFISSGSWTTLRGNARDPDAIIYELNPDKPKEARFFLRVTEDSIKMVDRQKNDIPSPFDLMLRKQTPGLPNPASANCVKLGGKLEIREDINGSYGICLFAGGRACEEWPLYRNKKCMVHGR
jgi:putative hemolysin